MNDNNDLPSLQYDWITVTRMNMVENGKPVYGIVDATPVDIIGRVVFWPEKNRWVYLPHPEDVCLSANVLHDIALFIEEMAGNL